MMQNDLLEETERFSLPRLLKLLLPYREKWMTIRFRKLDTDQRSHRGRDVLIAGCGQSYAGGDSRTIHEVEATRSVITGSASAGVFLNDRSDLWRRYSENRCLPIPSHKQIWQEIDVLAGEQFMTPQDFVYQDSPGSGFSQLTKIINKAGHESVGLPAGVQPAIGLTANEVQTDSSAVGIGGNGKTSAFPTVGGIWHAIDRTCQA
jgi:hypothetical protein